MGIFSRLFGSRSNFNDERIVAQAMDAVTNDPMVSDPNSLAVTSKKGIITVSGNVHKRQEKDRIEGVIRNALTTKNLKHERIVNELKSPTD